MPDLKFVGELYTRGWWRPYFCDSTGFEYVGNLEAFQHYISKRGILNDIIRLLGRRVNIAGLVTDLLNIPLIGGKDKTTILSEIIEIYEKHDARRTLMEWFSRELNRAKKEQRHFTSVSNHFRSNSPLFQARFTDIDSKFVILEGSICHKAQLRDNGPLYESASKSKCDWVICDFPPIGMDRRNSEYQGELVFLRLDDGLQEVFSEDIPFTTDIGWFPYCTIAGFINTRRLNIEQFPTLAMSLLFQRRAVSPEPNIDQLKRFVAGELRNPIYLKGISARVLLYYLLPMMYRTWKIGYEHIDQEVREIVQQFFTADREQLTSGLVSLYESRIFS